MNVTPMLCTSYNGRTKFPVYSQPKLDGVRALYDPSTKTLLTRNNKPIKTCQHIVDSIKSELVLDGEVILPGESFQRTISAVKKYSENSKNLVYMIFDTVHTGTFKERLKLIQDEFYLYEYRVYTSIALVHTHLVHNQEELDALYSDYLSKGYEGQIIRSDSEYINGRTSLIQKRKQFITEEFEIVGVEEGEGKRKAHVGGFILKSADGKLFNASPTGSYESMKGLLVNPPIGSMATVKFFEYSSYGIPRFPVVLGIRDYE